VPERDGEAVEFLRGFGVVSLAAPILQALGQQLLGGHGLALLEHDDR